MYEKHKMGIIEFNREEAFIACAPTSYGGEYGWDDDNDYDSDNDN